METKTIEFKLLNSELSRRIDAFTRLSISTLIALIAGFLLTKIPSFIWLIFVFIIFIILIISRILLIQFFKNFSQTIIYIKDNQIIRKAKKHTEIFNISDICEIKLIMTIKETIRDIQIKFLDSRRLSINALVHPDDFMLEVSKINTSFKLKKAFEPIDYDHPLFYVILGITLGLLMPLLISITSNLSTTNIKYLNIVISTFLILLGSYFAIKTPLAKSYGKNTKRGDYIWAAILIISGIVILISSFWPFI